MNQIKAISDIESDPITALAKRTRRGVLAVITGVNGPSYRPIGAVMAIAEDGQRVGTLSSGCIEADLVLHAEKALRSGSPLAVRYGEGSPFLDIQLPCGGGLNILLVPDPDSTILERIAKEQSARRPVSLCLNPNNGAISVSDVATGWAGDDFHVRFLPDIQFLIFGKGPEAATFARLVQSAGYPSILASPDAETIGQANGPTRDLVRAAFPADMAVDQWTAIVLFFHDHEWEPPILQGALQTDAFYIGSQGSQRARDARIDELKTMGVSEEAVDRLYGPIGLVPSARDARTLSVSVLAEILAVAKPAG